MSYIPSNYSLLSLFFIATLLEIISLIFSIFSPIYPHGIVTDFSILWVTLPAKPKGRLFFNLSNIPNSHILLATVFSVLIVHLLKLSSWNLLSADAP